ncbi:glycosyl transferase group 1 [Oleidesulfovibrio alaskensis G20]|uniref:Glycosyl transferase group 1 n=1 Tax=Oleidesulfovibrio alaskensis (strain ATCC BAA-1058 / DSM 17464 / G20) TaxID=207559 RepID=Q30XB4_OLEA2|nr:glycosyltransferase family 1 protein [Oleidesulfovibrio alaskensis]ABB39682.2 glycosyl transferase group 1 [Oleidesulfovibrio alaskensis G20]
MIRVAWPVANDPSWVAGLNYFRNLLLALLDNPLNTIEPVILGDKQSLPAAFQNQPSIPYFPALTGSKLSPIRVWDKLLRTAGTRGGLLSRHLEQHDIQALFPFGPLGRRSRVPVISWIPDFQHRHLPHFFSSKELRARNRQHSAMASDSQLIVVSSHVARQDFLKFHPGYEHKVRVLQFAASLPPDLDPATSESVLKKYDIREPYFHVPNQLWAHKNHSVIVEALAILKQRKQAPLVVSTGRIQDVRNSDYASSLIKKTKELRLESHFRFLGLIPFDDLCIIQRNAIALINPSLFEGWNTAVEEAKAMGKQIILSNIPVHKEQDPARATFFSPDNPEELAEALLRSAASFNLQEEEKAKLVAKKAHRVTFNSFATNYENIVKDAIK